jgi:carboxypeptidase C (cathepsin A)
MTGDEMYRRSKASLERILNNGVRVALIYGDEGKSLAYHSHLRRHYDIRHESHATMHFMLTLVDYICNWFGGEALSLQVQYENAKEFQAAGYVPFVVDGTEYGEVRQYGNFSFLRVYESGHEVPYYQPVAALEVFRRVLGNLILSDGSKPVTPDYETNGLAHATHTNSFVPLPSSSSSAPASSSSAPA